MAGHKRRGGKYVKQWLTVVSKKTMVTFLIGIKDSINRILLEGDFF